jgi:hypothetical protein
MVRAYIYRIDENDRLTEVDDSWIAFAEQNNASELTAATVRGQKLWQYISDPSTEQLYRHLIDRVRSEKRTIVVPFRCDSPDTRRFMELHLRPLARGGLEIASRIVREEARPTVALLADQGASTLREPLVRMCSWCKKVRVPDGWVEIEQAIAILGLFTDDAVPGLTHGMCEPCHESLFASHECVLQPCDSAGI